jgi:hypothetical protein
MIRFMLTEVPSAKLEPDTVLAPAVDDLLPWGDPYIVKLAQALEREARDHLEAALREEEGAMEEDDFGEFGHPPASRIQRISGWFADEDAGEWRGTRRFR